MKTNYKSADAYYIHGRFTADDYEGDYLKVIHNYIQYYYKYAETYKWLYLALSFIKLLILAAIPVTQTIEKIQGWPWIAAGLSSLCILMESLMELFRMKDKWILYRKAGNDLMHEERKYVTCIGKYKGENKRERLELFVEEAENIIGNEAAKWNQLVQAIKIEPRIQTDKE